MGRTECSHISDRLAHSDRNSCSSLDVTDKPLLFEDEELTEDRPRRDPVAPAKPSGSAKLKKKTHMTPGGLPVQSFRTLMAHLGTRYRNTCVMTADPNQTVFHQVTEADALQSEALRLIKM